MSFVQTIAPSVEPISLAEARTHCRRGNELDAVLPIYIQAAREEAEAYTQRSLITQTWECRLDAFPTESDRGPSIRLWHGPVQAVTSVRYVDPAGVTQTLSSTLYTTDLGLEPGFVLPAVGAVWPDTLEAANAVTVTFRAGYGDAASAVPAAIRAWMLMMIGALADNPAALDASGKVTGLPGRFVDRKLDTFILPSL